MAEQQFKANVEATPTASPVVHGKLSDVPSHVTGSIEVLGILADAFARNRHPNDCALPVTQQLRVEQRAMDAISVAAPRGDLSRDLRTAKPSIVP